MGTINVTLGDATQLNLPLGRQLENDVTEVVFDFSAWKTTYGTGTLSLSVQRKGDEMPYPVTMTVSGTNATWEVTDTDTARKGVGKAQLTYTVGDAVKKSVIYKFTVYESLGADGEYPAPGSTWMEDIEERVEALESGSTGGLTDSVKGALLQIAEKVAYIDDQGQTYYDALYDALYPPVTLSYITCVYTQSGTVYDTDTLDSLKTDLVVTAHYDNGTTQTVTTYTLSGTLTEGTSTITVAYGGKTTTFTVTVTHESKSDMDGWTDGVAYTDLTVVADEYILDTDGSFAPYGSWSRTGYVPCNGATSLTIPSLPGTGGNSKYNAFYTENKTFISSFIIKHEEVTIPVPDTAYYFALSELTSSLEHIIETGIIPSA